MEVKQYNLTQEEVNQQMEDYYRYLDQKEQHLKPIVSFNTEEMDDLIDLLTEESGSFVLL